jgi:NADPH-dependent 7-cyano-7-deazaguanine reductase QueF
MAGTGEIILIGHGKGQSNEADHLNKYLKSHHKDAHARIVQTIVADLSHLTMAELLKLGRDAVA